MPQNSQIILIAGPTASGKSALALKFAQELGAQIINADALQVYAEYEILTARPSSADLNLAPHKLYGHIIGENYSTGRWLREVENLLESSDSPLIFVGGTGLYFDVLLNGLNDIPSISANVRNQVAADYKNHGLETLIEELKTADPEIIKRIDLQNPMRIMRALEVWRETKAPLSNWQNQPATSIIKDREVKKLVLCPDKDETNHRIKARFQNMMQSGAIEEVQSQMNPWLPNAPANRALGASEIKSYLDGKIDEEVAIEKSIIATRQYAKRQRSWFRSRMKDWFWVANHDEALQKNLSF